MSAYASILGSVANSFGNNNQKFNSDAADNAKPGTAVYLIAKEWYIKLIFWALGDEYSHVIFKDANGKWRDTHWDGKSGVIDKESKYYADLTKGDRGFISVQANFDTSSISRYNQIPYMHSGFQVCTVYASRASNGMLWGLSPGQQAYNQIGYRPGIDGYYRGRP
jgi:hypothetical protein